MAYREAVFNKDMPIEECFVNVFEDYKLSFWYKTRRQADNGVDFSKDYNDVDCIYRIHVIPKLFLV